MSEKYRQSYQIPAEANPKIPINSKRTGIRLVFLGNKAGNPTSLSQRGEALTGVGQSE